ncbi:MAG: MFS transporter [Thermaceae bacterium]|nr:MFS transporter [Thermaceae bacterium]
MWTTLRLLEFRRLFLAGLVSQAGSKVHRIALLTLIYLLTHEAIWVSLVLGVQLLSSLIAGPLLAAWSDTQDRKRVMVLADIGRAILVPLIPLLGVHSLPLLLLLVGLVEVLTSMFEPASNAAVPDLVPEAQLDEANGLMYFASRFSEVAFVGLAGVLVAAVGAPFAFYFDALTYVASALFLLGLPELSSQASGKADYWERAREGVRFLWANPTVRVTVGLLFTAACFGSVEGVLGVVLANKVLGVGASGFGAMEAALALGAVLATLVFGKLTQRFRRERLFMWALGGFGLLEVSIGALPVFAWVLAAFFFSGLFNSLFIVPARSILQTNAQPEIRGRLFAAFGAVMNSAVLIGAMLGGLTEPWLGSPRVFLLAGLLVCLAVGVVALRGGIPQQKLSAA